MKKLLVLVLMLSIVPIAHASYTRGYYKTNGTYVNGYHKTSPDYTKLNNYSTKGIYNPYTEKQGTVNPYSYPTNSRRRYRY